MTTILPSDNPSVDVGIAIQQASENGTPLFENPLEADATTITQDVATAQADIDTIAAGSPPAAVTAILDDMRVALEEANDTSQNLNNHATTMIFGDTNGSIISGGLQANITQANSANVLSNTIGDRAGVVPSCDLFGDLFGSIQGIGKTLTDGMKTLVSDVKGALQSIKNFINGVTDSIYATLNDAIAAVNGFISAINTKINEITALIQSEIDNFTNWAKRQLDFAFGSVMNNLKSDPCVSALISSVGTAEFTAILNA